MDGSFQSARYELTIEGLSDVRPIEVEYEGALNETYRLTVMCAIAEKRKEGVQEVTEALRGKNASLRIRREDAEDGDSGMVMVEEFIRGMVVAAHRVGRLNPTDTLGVQEEWILEHSDMFRVEIVPALEFLKFEIDKPKMWHNQTYKKALDDVLTPALKKYDRSWRDEIDREDIIDSIIQVPGESDLEFVLGLCTEGGINAFFDHSGDKEVLVLTDKNAAFIEGTTWQTIPLRVGTNMSGLPAEWIGHFETRTDSDFNEVKQKAFDQIESPAVPFFEFEANPAGFLGAIMGLAGGLAPGGLSGLGGGGGGGGLDTGVLQKWEWLRPNEVGDKEFQFQQAAKDDASRLQTNLLRNDLKSGVIGMVEGKSFDIETKPDDTRRYVVERVKFKGGRGGDDASPDGVATDYYNEATVVPLTTKSGGEVIVRAPKTQLAQKMPGFSLAEIVALETHPVEVDEFMRVRFRFLWDETEPTPQECWMMVMQPMAGRFGGHQHIPREGDRVLLAFIEGNRSLAVIVGGFYDEEFRPPIMGPKWITLRESDLILGFSHSSVERGKKPAEQAALDRVSQMSIDVTAHEEMFFFNAPWDWQQDIGHDCEINIENDRRVVVKEGNWSLDVQKGTHSETVKGAKTERFMGGLDKRIHEGFFECTHTGDRTIWADEGDIRIWGNKLISIKSEEIVIEDDSPMGECGGLGKASGGMLALQKTVARLENASEAIVQSQETRARLTPDHVDIETPGDVEVKSPRGTTIDAGTTQVGAKPEAFTVRTPKAELEDAAGGKATLTNGSYTVDVPQGITFRCGQTELRLSPEGVFINGQLVRIEATNAEIHAERVDITGDHDRDRDRDRE